MRKVVTLMSNSPAQFVHSVFAFPLSDLELKSQEEQLFEQPSLLDISLQLIYGHRLRRIAHNTLWMWRNS